MSAVKDNNTPGKSGDGHVVDGLALPVPSGSLLVNLVQIPCLIWAFTESNFITFVLPNTAFGVLGALAGPELLQNDTRMSRLTLATMLWPTLLAMAFNWANVLIFDRKSPCYLHIS